VDRTEEHAEEIWYEGAGTRLHARSCGRGTPVVFVHGGLADHRASLFHVGRLAASYRLITPDARGAGRSVYAGALSWEQLADDLVALLDQLGLARAVVGGTSAGSAIALTFAARHPERTQALLLISPVYAGSRAGLNPAQRSAFDRMDLFAQQALQDGIEALYPLFASLPDTVRQIALELVRSFDPASVAATTRWLASAVQPFDDLAELAKIEPPTLVVPGSDPEHPSELGQRYASALAHATLASPGDDLVGTIEAFLERCGGLRERSRGGAAHR
jgi:3-oxoadipate enol-lactonase